MIKTLDAAISFLAHALHIVNRVESSPEVAAYIGTYTHKSRLTALFQRPLTELRLTDMTRLASQERHMNPSLPIQLVSDKTTLMQIQHLRYLAWSANGEVPEFIRRQNILSDRHDVGGMHFAIVDQGKVVAAARLNVSETIQLSPDPEALDGYEENVALPVATLTRCVVDPQYRRLGLAQRLREERVRVALAGDAGSIVAIAEEEAVMRSYEDMGFARLGPTKLRYLSYAQSVVLLRALK